ncbi:MAG TPA: heme peroxidase family protein, partial [Rubrobacteraceae bacterium]|nr:heme peroxidase family protein [Rubrobacteraceae bacterium]
DAGGAAGGGNSDIPAAYTYFGQFVDHDITLETQSATLPELLDPDLTPLTLDQIEENLQNGRTATLELDSVYGFPAPRDGAGMQLGKVTPLNGSAAPFLRPPGKDDDNDLPREARSSVAELDRAARIGDARNDENTIIAQLQVAFLRAHNELVGQGLRFGQARRQLRQHYQHIVLHDFLKRIVDPQVVDDIIENGNSVFDPDRDETFMPLEFSVAAYRFGHSMVRAAYNFNVNFNTSGQPGTTPATLFPFLFTFSALSGQLGEFDTLPDNWIIEWENLVDAGASFDRTRRIDTKLVEPLFQLTDFQGRIRRQDRARLAVRNLLRGYRLRIPTGQAVAGALETPVLSPQQIRDGAASEDQIQVLEDAGFLERTPLWYYILAEAAVHEDGQRLGPVGGTIVAEVLVGLVRRSENSILRADDWEPTLPSAQPGTFTLPDLLRTAGVLT